MTAHKVRVKVANGSRIVSKGTRRVPEMVRIMGSFPVSDWKALQHVAAVKKIPVAQVLRDAVFAYALPFRSDVA